MADAEDRSLPATEKRLQRARDEGQVPLSRELVVAAGMAAAALVLVMVGPGLAHSTALRLRDMLVRPADPAAAVHEAAAIFLAASLPLLAAVGFVGAAAALVQTGFLFHGASAMPDLARLDPRRGLRRVFGGSNLVEAAKSLVKLAAVCWALWSTVGAVGAHLAQATLWTEATLLDRIVRELLRLLLTVLAVQCVLAVLDVAATRWRHAKRLRMSREEQKQEARESEGDPHIKAKLRQMRAIRAKKRMLSAVAKATVVITNPTHYAVALAYDRAGVSAPRVVAKGVDEVAARIREAAQKAGVPLVANPPLARALHQVPLDAEIPAEHFKLVAEVIAYVWRLRGATGRQK